MNNITASNGAGPLIQALEEVWRNNPGVKKFGLSYDANAIEHDHGLWAVPVASGALTGNALDLRQALTSIQQDLESRTSMDITVLLVPA